MEAYFGSVLLQNREDRELPFRQFLLYDVLCTIGRFQTVFPRQQTSNLTDPKQLFSVYQQRMELAILIITFMIV